MRAVRMERENLQGGKKGEKGDATEGRITSIVNIDLKKEGNTRYMVVGGKKASRDVLALLHLVMNKFEVAEGGGGDE